ncbi:MAG: hypothetical protein ACJAT1_000186 [Marivirga sp.]|jgi:hypothetical protein
MVILRVLGYKKNDINRHYIDTNNSSNASLNPLALFIKRLANYSTIH